MGESENEKLIKHLRTYIKKRVVEKIRSLLSNPLFDVNVRDLTQDLQTPLMKICYSEIHDNHLMALIDVLLDRNADLNVQDSLGRTAVMHACLARRTLIADYMISDPTTGIEIFDFDGNSVLTHAVKSIDYIIAKRILEHPSGPALLEIYNSNGQKPLHVSIKTGNKKMIRLIEQYEAKIPKLKLKEKDIRLEHSAVSSTYSPRTERNIHVKRGTPPNTTIALKLDTSSMNDDSDHAISLTSARLGRSKKCGDVFSPELILPSITEKTETKKTVKSEPPLSRKKTRRNSVSLPDLRDTPNCLIRSGENTPLMNLDSPETDDYDDDDAFINAHRSPRKRVDTNLNIKRCISENQLSFPNIVSKNTRKSSSVRRTLTDSSIFSNSDDGLSRSMHKLL